MDEQEIIQKLSELHKENSTNPETLCSATFRDFDLEHPDYLKHHELRNELFVICHTRGDAWTKIPHP